MLSGSYYKLTLGGSAISLCGNVSVSNVFTPSNTTLTGVGESVIFAANGNVAGGKNIAFNNLLLIIIF